MTDTRTYRFKGRFLGRSCNFEFVLDANSCKDDHIESSTANVEQTQTSYTPTQPTQKDKQVQVEPCPENARSFRSIGTQTGDVAL